MAERVASQIELIKYYVDNEESYSKNTVKQIKKLNKLIVNSKINLHQELPKLHHLRHNLYNEVKYIKFENKLYNNDLEELFEYKENIYKWILKSNIIMLNTREF
ncbi:MAG: hypothetical protein DRG78_01760 [Epsilonproteobacteria bacterium]|nr:MAG: hypothetical protein DRG78_01760 [Campylobacterota bacterium]